MIVIFLNLYIITVRERPLWLLAQGAKTPSYATVMMLIGMMSVFLTESSRDAQMTDCMAEGGWTPCEERDEFGVPCLLHVLVHLTVWRLGSLHFALEFRTCPTKVIDLLWHIVLLNYIFEMLFVVWLQPHDQQMLVFLFSSRRAGSNSYSDFPSTLHCYENCLFHAQPLHISIITWPFQSPRYHWLAALHMPRLPAICRRPFRVFRERVMTNRKKCSYLLEQWPYGFPDHVPIFLDKASRRSFAPYWRPTAAILIPPLSDTSTLAIRDINFLFLFIIRIFISTYT